MCKGNESAQGRLDLQSAVCEMACFFLVLGMEHGVCTYTVGGYLGTYLFGKSGGFRIQVDDPTDRHKCWSLEKRAKIH